MAEVLKREEKLNVGDKIITFIGPEGSGKTTIARKLAELLGKPYITTGDIIRDLAANDPGQLGEDCRQMFENHTYLSGETLLTILVQRFGDLDTENGLILDGGLRTLEETLAFQGMLDTAGRNLPMMVIYLHIPDTVSIERLVTGENARKRADDTLDGVLSRLAKFNHRLEDRICAITANPNWELVRVDATMKEDEVFEEVVRLLAV